MNIDEHLVWWHDITWYWYHKVASIMSMGFTLQNASEEESSDSDQNNEKNLGSSSSSSSERYVNKIK